MAANPRIGYTSPADFVRISREVDDRPLVLGLVP